MKNIVFLIGGAGNVFFQLLKASNMKKDSIVVSEFFISSKIRKVLKHTDHPNIYAKLFNVKKTFLFSPYLLLLCFDLFLAKVSGRTLFSNIDLRSVRGKPILINKITFGYFQKNVSFQDIIDLNELVVKGFNVPSEYLKRRVIHIRGGDFIKYGSSLSIDYYKRAIDNINHCSSEVFLVVTNDVIYAEEVMSNIKDVKYDVISNNEIADYTILNSSITLICSNSTFALTAGLTGGDIREVVLPCDFYNMFNSEKVVNVPEIIVI